jgi:2-amino-4-hydroxy-6-hydroxymethyldihydropteridine diphosphokinase
MHPLPAVIAAAAQGQLPHWTEARPKRRAHMSRVAGLLGEWAALLQLPPHEHARWTATGWLHDTLRDAAPETLRNQLDEPLRSLPPFFLHGPAAAARLEREGVHDADLLDAIRFHTLGSPGLARLGRALITADFLEPGRPQLPVWRAALRARMPGALEQVFREVVARRLHVTLERGRPLRHEFVAMWNDLAGAHDEAG